MAPLYPYFFDVDGFPDVRVVGLTPEQQARNLKALKTMLRLAAERGIHVKPGIWDHIYRGGIQAGANPVGIERHQTHARAGVGPRCQKSRAVHRRRAQEVLRHVSRNSPRRNSACTRNPGCAVPRSSRSGTRSSGSSASNRPNIKLEFRAKGLPKSVIKDAQAQGLNIQLDTKIWMEQMGLPYHPTHINRENQMDARQSYADLLEYPQTYHMNWTLVERRHDAGAAVVRSGLRAPAGRAAPACTTAKA